MIFVVIAASAGLFFFALRLRSHFKSVRHGKAFASVRGAGVSMDEQQNIDAQMTLAGMQQHEETSGRCFTGKQARFMELMRIVSDGPNTPDEIRFLFDEGIEPVVRPDGMVYVPCIENEHLSVEGEIELLEEDLDLYVTNGLIQQASDRGSDANGFA